MRDQPISLNNAIPKVSILAKTITVDSYSRYYAVLAQNLFQLNVNRNKN